MYYSVNDSLFLIYVLLNIVKYIGRIRDDYCTVVQ